MYLICMNSTWRFKDAMRTEIKSPVTRLKDAMRTEIKWDLSLV